MKIRSNRDAGVPPLRSLDSPPLDSRAAPIRLPPRPGVYYLANLYLPSGPLVQSHSDPSLPLILSTPVIVASRTVIDGESREFSSGL